MAGITTAIFSSNAAVMLMAYTKNIVYVCIRQQPCNVHAPLPLICVLRTSVCQAFLTTCSNDTDSTTCTQCYYHQEQTPTHSCYYSSHSNCEHPSSLSPLYLLIPERQCPSPDLPNGAIWLCLDFRCLIGYYIILYCIS